MNYDLVFFPTVIQTYQNDGMVTTRDGVQWNPVYVWEDFHLQLDSNPRPEIVSANHLAR